MHRKWKDQSFSQPVGGLAGDRVAQLDLPVDPGIGLALMPGEPHLVDQLVDQRDTAVPDLRAGVDLFQQTLLTSRPNYVAPGSYTHGAAQGGVDHASVPAHTAGYPTRGH